MNRPLSHRLCLGSLAAGLMGAPAVAEPGAKAMELLRENCLRCHGGEDKVKGKVDLRPFQKLEDFGQDLELLDEMVAAIEFGDMPPEDEEPLEDAERTALLEHLQAQLDKGLNQVASHPVTPVRRMNRFQYANAVQDLFGLKVAVFSLPERMMRGYGNYFDPASGKMPKTVTVGSRPLGKSQMIEPRLAGVAPFPQDLRAEHGYDNQADHLSLSPMLMENFLTLARSITLSPDFHAKNVGIWTTFFAKPTEAPDRKTMSECLRPFLSRAFREPVDEATLDRYVGHALERLEKGVAHEQVMRDVAAAVLASPRFLYLRSFDPEAERSAPEDQARHVASRLALFLHGSLPDDELLRLAEDGSLLEAEVLAEQAERMMNDRRMKRFCDSFAAQWLQLDRIISSRPDKQKFKDFYFLVYRKSMWMMSEPLLLFETVFVENRPIRQLIDSDFSYRSKSLSNFYAGRPATPNGPVTAPFERVPLKDAREGGVITCAATMTMTSGEKRTHPITRGAWLLTVILNDPPEPPPANVPALPEGETEGELATKTIREVFVIHREREDCASCHNTIDPLGFALENYDPVGRWREVYDNGLAVDASGTLFRDKAYGDIAEFKALLLENPQRFARAFASHLLRYALGRELTAVDTPSIDQIVERSAKDDYRLRTVLREVVLSPSFRN